MATPVVVFVSGPPASGKTTMARELSRRVPLPLIAKDDIKESLGDSLGKTSLLWSKRLGAATWDLLFVLLERTLMGGGSLIFESNFYPDLHRPRLNEIRTRLPFVPFEVHCTADPATLAQRNNERPRHPVHHSRDGTTARVMAKWVLNNGPLELSERVFRVDTGTSDPVDLDGIVADIRGIRDGS
jgi:predicted kinase